MSGQLLQNIVVLLAVGSCVGWVGYRAVLAVRGKGGCGCESCPAGSGKKGGGESGKKQDLHLAGAPEAGERQVGGKSREFFIPSSNLGLRVVPRSDKAGK